jgi:hypothetical protein
MRVKSERRALLESAVTLILWVSEGVTFVLKLARKDLSLATELGRECNVPMALANVVEQDILEAIAVRELPSASVGDNLSPTSGCRRGHPRHSANSFSSAAGSRLSMHSGGVSPRPQGAYQRA